MKKEFYGAMHIWLKKCAQKFVFNLILNRVEEKWI